MFFISKKKTPDISDLDLIAHYKATGDSSYTGQLFERYSHLVFGVCLKYLKNEEESRDAVMAIFEKLMEDLKKHEIAHFKGWLHSVARNYCLMHLRTRKYRNSAVEDILPEVMESESFLHLHYANDTEYNLSSLNMCVEQLTEEQKQCINLFFFQEKCYKEIVVLTAYSLNQVKSYIQNGKRNLRNCIEGKTRINQ